MEGCNTFEELKIIIEDYMDNYNNDRHPMVFSQAIAKPVR
jgi:hypothetical protein